jgi:ABC-2 type transport system ATP-binding protein
MLQVNQLNYHYDKASPLYDSVDIQLETGKLYGLLGKNGAGKTTLLKCVMGLLFPKSGDCQLENLSTKKRLPSTLGDLFYLPEQITPAPVKISTYGKMNAPFYPKFSLETFREILREFDLSESMYLNKISHGMLKKAMIAFGIATNTNWLLLDEPTNGLDIPSKSLFKKVISSYLSENRGVIISTHQVRDIENLIDTVLILDRKKIALNSGISDLANKLSFSMANSPDDLDHVLYSEDTGMGVRAICSNQNGTDSRIDLELLFNSVIVNSDTINSALKEESNG